MTHEAAAAAPAIVVSGTVTLDTVMHEGAPAPHTTPELGGSATYAALSASYFAPTTMLSAVGMDLPEEYLVLLRSRLHPAGLLVLPGSTFRYACTYDRAGNRTDISTSRGVLASFTPHVPASSPPPAYVHLATHSPGSTLAFLRSLERRPRIITCDTHSHWVQRSRQSVMRLIAASDIALLNDAEARAISKSDNIHECAKTIQDKTGVPWLIIKKGPHGAHAFASTGHTITAPAYPPHRAPDPTGAGDAFAGALLGYLASMKSRRHGRRRAVPHRHVRRALAYAVVMGSFAAERRGVRGLLNLTAGRIRRRTRPCVAGLPSSPFPHFAR